MTEQNSGWVVGIDLGATKIAAGLITPANQIIKKVTAETIPEEGAETVVERIARCMEQLYPALPPETAVEAVGICCPGPLDHVSGMVFDPPNLTGWLNVPLRQMLADRLHLPVALEHDAKAAALGEYYFGIGQGERSMVYIVIGTGVGGAIIIDGQLYRGMHNAAGEVGHITINFDGEPGSSGINGNVESFMSGPYLVHQFKKLQPTAPETLTGEEITHRAGQGDQTAREVMDQAGQALGTAVASLAMILDIELYVIGGSVVNAGDLLLEPARRTVPQFCFGSVAERVRIEPVALGGDGPILGCGWIARKEHSQAG